MPQKKSYKELLEEAKANQNPSEREVASMRMKASSVCNELGSDLGKFRLVNVEQVRALIEAKFSESYDREMHARQENPPSGGTVIRLAEVILGLYPGAAFNLWVVLFAGNISVYFQQVPKGGNLRE